MLPDIRKINKILLFILFLICACDVALAQAPPMPPDILDGMLGSYKSASNSWLGKIEPIAKSLFWKLAAIEFAWSSIIWVLQNDQIQSFTAAVVKKLIGIGFFYALLINASDWIPAIINGFTEAGRTTANVNRLTPSLVFDRGIDVASNVLGNVNLIVTLKNPFVSFVAGWVAIFIVIAFAIIAGQLLIALIESYIVISAGLLFLGFGGSRWTSDIAQKYIGYAVATGVKLFVIYLIIGVGMAQSATWGALLSEATFSNLFTVLGASLLLTFLAFQIPNMAASMLSGAPSLTAGSAAGASTAIATGTVAAGATAISPVMQSARGGAQALKAGYDYHRAAGDSRLSSGINAVRTATMDYGKEAVRSTAESIGLAHPTASLSSTVGGRAAEVRNSSIDAMREQQSAGNASMSSLEPSQNTATPQANNLVARNSTDNTNNGTAQTVASSNPSNKPSAREKQIFRDVHQVRPPQIPNDSAPQVSANFHMGHNGD